MSGQLGTIPYPLMGQWQNDPGIAWQQPSLPPPDLSPLYAPPAIPLVEQPVPVYGPNVLAPPQDTPASWQQQPVYQPPTADALPLPPAYVAPPGAAPAPLVQGSPGVAAHDPSQMPTVTIGPDGKPVSNLQTTTTGQGQGQQQQPKQQTQQPQQAQAPTVQQLYPDLFAPSPPYQPTPIAQVTMPQPIQAVTPPVPQITAASAVGRPLMFAPPIYTQMSSSYGANDEHERTANRYRSMLS